MGSTVYWLCQSLEGKQNIKQVIRQDEKILSLLVSTNKGDKEYVIYRAFQSEYVLTVENIDEAIELGANLIVYDEWGEVTGPARDKALGSKIAIYKFGFFMHELDEGRCLLKR